MQKCFYSGSVENKKQKIGYHNFKKTELIKIEKKKKDFYEQNLSFLYKIIYKTLQIWLCYYQFCTYHLSILHKVL